MKNFKKTQLVAVLVAVGVLVGCASKATTTNDGTTITGQSRTLPERMTDFGIQRNVINGLSNIDGVSSDNVRVAVTSFRGDVLLTGEVASEQMKTQIGNMALSIREVKDLYNYLQASDVPKSQSHTNHEKYLQSKIRTKLLGSSLSMSQYKVVVRSDIAYVMGEMTKEQQDEIIDAVRNTDGIQGVVLANKILSISDIANSYGNPQNTQNYNNQPNNTGYDDTAVYPSSANATNSAQYNNNTGYPNSLYTNNGQPTYNAPQSTTSYQPVTQPSNQTINTVQPNATSGYVKLYQGTNNP